MLLKLKQSELSESFKIKVPAPSLIIIEGDSADYTIFIKNDMKISGVSAIDETGRVTLVPKIVYVNGEKKYSLRPLLPNGQEVYTYKNAEYIDVNELKQAIVDSWKMTNKDGNTIWRDSYGKYTIDYISEEDAIDSIYPGDYMKTYD